MAANPHFLDLMSPETRARLTPEMILAMDAQEQQKTTANKMVRYIAPTQDDPREQPHRNPGLKYPSFRYHADGRSKVIRSEKEESQDWTRKPPENIHELRAGTATAYDPTVEKLEDENIQLKRQLQEVQAKLSRKG